MARGLRGNAALPAPLDMTTHDTDPQHSPPVLGSPGSADDTGPGSAPGDSDSPSVALAVSLLENVGAAALPTDGIAQTDGHTAAAFAAGAHRPPKPHEPDLEPQVVLNTTQPLPFVVVPAAPGAARALTTVPGARAKAAHVDTEPRPRTGTKRALAWVAIVVLAGVGVAVAAVLPAQRPVKRQPASGTEATASSRRTAAPIAPTPTAPALSASLAITPQTAPGEAVGGAVKSARPEPAPHRSPSMPARSASPTASVVPPPPVPSTRHAPRPTGAFDEPERTVD